MLRRLLFGVAMLALLAPAPVAAKSRTTFFPPFRVAGTNGYKVEIYAEAEGENAREVGPSVVASVWDQGTETTYVAPGRIEEDRYSASFGRFGRVEVRYERRPPRLVAGCRGGRSQEEEGRVSGTIEFHGDRHFTDVDYPHFHARTVPEPKLICFSVGEGGKGARLDGLSRYGTVKAYANGRRGPVRFEAEAKDKLGPMLIYRDLRAFGPSKDFVRSRRLTSARITPPDPFHGSASYHGVGKRRESGPLRGDLTVDFPGFPRYPLTTRPTLAFLEPGGCEVSKGARFAGPPILCL